ncbi:MAG: cytochrome c biogenesis protein CcdA [Cyanobium sp.]|nr:cytochrome c biogenesis protein CcdA [Cyanobium sp.]
MARTRSARARGLPRIRLYLGLGLIALLSVIVLGPQLSRLLTTLISLAENNYQQWLNQQDTSNPLLLLPLAFAGGLLASVSPCILALLPVNLSYIGTLKIESRLDAFSKASMFVLGSVTILSLIGLVSSFAGALMIDYRGFIHVAVGLVMAVMGLWLAGILQLPLASIPIKSPPAGPYGVGLTFALVSSPCTSPVLFAVLAAAAATGSQWMGALTMMSYALGYTALIFLASLSTGLVKSSRRILTHSETMSRIGSAILVIAGLYYVGAGAHWFLAN